MANDLVKVEALDIKDPKVASDMLKVFNDANATNVTNKEHFFGKYVFVDKSGRYRFFGINNIYNALIGFTFFSLYDYEAHLERIAVKSICQSKGNGGLLLEESLKIVASSNSIEFVSAYVIPTERRLKFYSNHGFTDLLGEKLGEKHTKLDQSIKIIRPMKT